MNIKHKRKVYSFFNLCLPLLLLFQSTYPFFYNSKIYAQTSDVVKVVENVQETQTSDEAEEVVTEDPVIVDGTSEETPVIDNTEEVGLEEPPVNENAEDIVLDEVTVTDETGAAALEQDSAPDVPPSSELPEELLEEPDKLPQPELVITPKEEKPSEKSLVEETLKRVPEKRNSLGEKRNNSDKSNKDYVEGEVLVKFKEGKVSLNKTSGRTTASNFAKSKNLEKKEDIRKSNISVMKIKDDKSVEDKVKELKKDKNVEYAQPNYIYKPATIDTNDTYKDLLWGLDSSSDKDIDAPEAWVISEGNGTIVAVIDSGVAYDHPDLMNSMWDGSSCVDDLGAYLGGCNSGYDYESNDKTPLPTGSSHGTHIAGTIAAEMNNGKGIIGVAPSTKIMAIKSSLTTAEITKGIKFAEYNGAKIINASWTGSNNDLVLKTAINGFAGLFIAAAGNDGLNNDSGNPAYPCDYDSINIVCVAATDQNDNLASFSNYGASSVDVAAPGTNIYSTVASENAFLFETFESAPEFGIPSGWVTAGTNNNWGIYSLGGDWGNVLYGDLNYPYENNANTTITSPTYDLGNGGANLSFWAGCDTEYKTDGWYDYMQLEYSADGVNFSPAEDPYYPGEDFRWDEPTFDFLNGDSLDATGSSTYYYDNVSIPSQYNTSNFKLRFRWVSNSADNYYDGCLVDDIKISKYSDGSDEVYDYYDGTSMATPHVAGLAALLWGEDPSLTVAQVKNAILNTGDTVSDLAGKTVTGKRINAYNALLSVDSSREITSFDFTNPSVTGVVDESSHTISLTVPYGTNVTSLTPTISFNGASISPLSGVAQDFTSPITYTVTAANGTTQNYLVTVSVEAPSTVTTISSETYTVGENTITNVPFNTSKTAFLAALTKDEPNQTWVDTNLDDPILSGNELTVTAQDGTTTTTYTISVNEVSPVLGPIGNKTIDELTMLTFTASATDPDGPNTTYYLTNEPTGASIDSTSGVFTFTPTEAQGPNTYNMTVFVTDGSNVDYEDITITVNEVNVAPISQDVSDSLDEDGSKTISLVASDNDEPGNFLDFSIVSGAQHGNLGTLSGGEVSYTPNENYNGSDSFTYKVNDGSLDSNVATVSIIVNPVNDAPTVSSEVATIDEDSILEFTFTGNDIDGDDLGFTVVDTPTNGVLSVISETQVNYEPNENYVGSDSFTYKANDGLSDSNIATISITVRAINDTPILEAIGNKTIDELDTLTFTANATDPDSSVTYSLINAPTGASIGSTSGVFTFTPTENQGPNSYNLTVSVTDGNTSDTEEITITVNEVNVAPTTNNFSVSIVEDTPKDITLTASDDDIPTNTLTYSIVDNPTNGAISLIDGTATYTPNENYNGSDSFTYKVNDGSVDSNTSTVNITVDPVNDAPSISTSAPTSATEDVLYSYDADQDDVDGPSAVWSKTTLDTCNGAIDSVSGVYTFTPSGPTPIDSCEISVKVNDGGTPNLSAEQTTTVTITPVNDSPTAVLDDYSTDEDNTLNITAPGILVNDSDPENSALTTALVSDVSNGSLTLNADGSFSYIPTLNYNGVDSFTYKNYDGTDYSNTVTVNITVDPVNDAPVANSDTFSVDEDSDLIVAKTELLSNDTDVDNDNETLTVSAVSNPVNGAVIINGDNVEFAPTANYFGSASFDYTVTDNSLTSTARVNITVDPVNDAPVISTLAPTSATEDILYTYDAEVTDTDGPSAVWSKTGSDTCNGNLDTATGYYSFTPAGPVPPASCVLSIKVDDGAEPSLSAIETKTISISAVNDAPTAYATTAETDEDTSVDISLSGWDPENDALTYLVSSNPTHGNVNIVGNIATYIPNPGYNGSDSFEFKVNDGSEDSSNALVSLTVTGINDAPVIESISNQTIDEYYNLQITPVVTDVDGGTPSFSLTNSAVANSSINTETGEFNFTPDESQGGGTYNFTIEVNDGNDINNTATEDFTITVIEVNNSPTAVDDTAATDEDTVAIIAQGDLLTNDTDPDNITEDFSITNVSNASPSGSTVIINGSSIEFTAPNNFNGDASFEYLMSDGELTDTGLVTITVNSVNDAPVAYADNSSIDEDGTLVISKASLLANDEDVDGDTLSISLVSDPLNGAVELDGDNIVFTPNLNYNGSASFSYTVTDGELTDTAIVSITVNPVNDAPVLNTVGDKTIDELTELNFTVTASDVEGSTLGYSLTNSPTGTYINSLTGEFSFTPTEIQGPGSYIFDINVTDGDIIKSETITVTVNEVNSAPVANDVNTTTSEDLEKTIALAAIDSDIPTQSITYSKVTDPSNGVVSIDGDSATYTPNANFYGSDSFTYKASDGEVDSNTSTVFITVTAINDAPTANPDSASVDEDGTLSVSKVTLIENDTDVDDTSLVLSAVSNPVNGLVYLDGSNVKFTPTANYFGPASFDYTVSDGSLTDTTTVSITVNSINDAPSVNDGTTSIDEDSSVPINLIGSDIEGDSLSYIIVGSTSNGTLEELNGNQIIYTPNENYFGSDSFTFKASDGELESNIGTITITVNSVNDLPVLNTIGDKTVNELEGLTFTANATDADLGDSLTYSLTNEPTGASIDSTSGVFTFTPTEMQGPNTYTFTITVSDGNDTDSEEITVTVNEVNLDPVSQDINITTNEDTSKIVVLVATDADLPENTITYIIETGVSHGTLSSISGNEVTYTPSTNYYGSDSFTYKANDGLSDGNISTVSITVNPVNDAPTATSDSVSTDEDTNLTIDKNDILANDEDVDGDTLILTEVSNPTHGTVIVSGSNVIFTPEVNFNGDASFDYTLSDGNLTDTGTVLVTVTPVNDAPTAANDTYTTTQEAPISVTLLGSDIEEDTLSYTVISGPSNGSLSAISGNKVTYTPNTDYIGADSFTYKANDGEYDSGNATIAITVFAPPVISGETSSGLETTSITVNWTTDHPSTSRVIYDTASHTTLGAAPNYGYAQSTVEEDNSPMVINHSVTLTGLTPGTTYYYRVVSHGSPEVVGSEMSFKTKSLVEEDKTAPETPENIKMEYSSLNNTIRLTWENKDSDIDKVHVYMGYSGDFDKNSGSKITENEASDEDVTVDGIELGKTYYFKLVAEDGAGNKSSTRTVSIEVPENLGDKAVVNTNIGPAILGLSSENNESGEGTKNKAENKGDILGTEDVSEAIVDENGTEEEIKDKPNYLKFFVASLLVILLAVGIALKRKKDY